jgi:hypothetical protein
MTARYNSQTLVARDEVVAAPAQRACADHSFEMPTGIYVAMVLLFAAAIAVLATAFTSGMAVSYAIVFAFLIAFFGVPAIFVRMAPSDEGSKALGWSIFREKGIATATGRTSGGEASMLVLLLPFLVLCWAIAIVTIAALV